jgi:formamidopyrimidine-DNA glycosylase
MTKGLVMPELPEVETVVRDLRAHGLEQAVIRAVDVRWSRTIEGMTPARFSKALCGRTISRLSRRGKYIILTLDDGLHLLIHLRMTGKLRTVDGSTPPGKHDHVILTLANGHQLVFNDTRKFGRFRLTRDAGAGLAHLGPEPLDAAFTAPLLKARLQGKTRMIKPLLLDQSCVAGLGNIYVDEALWQAGVHPERRAATLTPAEIKRLHHAIRTVLQRGVENGGTTLGHGETNFYSIAGHRGRNADGLKVFRRTGLPCPRCHTPIVRTVVGQRGTHFCPVCQNSMATALQNDDATHRTQSSHDRRRGGKCSLMTRKIG